MMSGKKLNMAHVSHGSRVLEPRFGFSIPKRCSLERTRLLCLYDELHTQRCGWSTGLVERAICELSPAIDPPPPSPLSCPSQRSSSTPQESLLQAGSPLWRHHHHHLPHRTKAYVEVEEMKVKMSVAIKR